MKIGLRKAQPQKLFFCTKLQHLVEKTQDNNNQINDTTLENIIALNKADAESNGVYCWGTSSTCLTDWNGDRIVGIRQNF